MRRMIALASTTLALAACGGGDGGGGDGLQDALGDGAPLDGTINDDADAPFVLDGGGGKCGTAADCDGGVCVEGICCSSAAAVCAGKCCGAGTVCLFDKCVT